MKLINSKGDTKIFALGGLGEVGKNMYCVMTGNEIVITDVGITFPSGELPGIDYIIPDFTFLKKSDRSIRPLVRIATSEASFGDSFISTELTVPFLTRITRSAISAKKLLCVTITTVCFFSLLIS